MWRVQNYNWKYLTVSRFSRFILSRFIPDNSAGGDTRFCTFFTFTFTGRQQGMGFFPKDFLSRRDIFYLLLCRGLLHVFVNRFANRVHPAKSCRSTSRRSFQWNFSCLGCFPRPNYTHSLVYYRPWTFVIVLRRVVTRHRTAAYAF